MADAQYIIQIAAALEGGEATAAGLEDLDAKLRGAGRRSDDYAAALAKLESSLDVARAASAAANAALAEGSDRYRELERSAVMSARALERAQAKGRFDPRAARDAEVARRALDAYAGELKKLESAAGAASASQKKLEGQITRVSAAAKGADAANSKANQRYEKLAQAAGLLPGPLRLVAQNSIATAKASRGLTAVLGAESAQMLVFAGVAAVGVAAVVALTAAVMAGYVAFGKYAVVTADAAREMALTREAFAALSPEMAAAAGAFDAVTESTGLTDAALLDISKSLRAAKVSAADMPRALRAAAMAEAALGKGGSAEFVRQLQAGELAVGGFAETVQAKFGGVVEKRLLGLNALGAKFSRNWSKLFAGLDIDPVLRALNTLVGMFDQANPLAQFFGAVIKGAFAPIAGSAESAAYAVEAFALQVAIGMTKAYIFVKENSALIEAVLGGIAIAIGAAFFGIPGILAVAFSALIMYKDQLIALGGQLMQGLADGITAGVTWVVNAITGAVTTAIDTAKSILGIASPSKVFAEIGANTVEGFTGAVDAGTADAAASLEGLTNPAPAQGAPALVGGSAPSTSINLSGATFNFHGVADAESATVRFGELLTRLIEGDADSIAGAQVPT